MLAFVEGGKTGVPQEKPSKQGRGPTTNQTHMWQQGGIEPAPHLWEASALIKAPFLVLTNSLRKATVRVSLLIKNTANNSTWSMREA